MSEPPWLAFVRQECVLGPRVWVCPSNLDAARIGWARRHGVSLPPSDLLGRLVAARVAVAPPGGLVCGVGLAQQWRYEETHPEFVRRMEAYAGAG